MTEANVILVVGEGGPVRILLLMPSRNILALSTVSRIVSSGT